MMNDIQLKLLLDLRIATTLNFFMILVLFIVVVYLLVKQIRARPRK